MAKGKSVIKLDHLQAYQQMQLEEESAQYLTINTHTGMYHAHKWVWMLGYNSPLFLSFFQQYLFLFLIFLNIIFI